MELDLEGLAEELPKIKIVQIPKGEAPLEIRQKWVGIEMPCLCKSGRPIKVRGILTDRPEEKPLDGGYLTLQVLAILALEMVCPEAANYWKEQGFPRSDIATFLFDTGAVEEIDPVLTEEEFGLRINGDPPYSWN